MQLRDDVGPRRAEHLVAALERGAAEVVGAQLGELQVGAGRAVEDDDARARRRCEVRSSRPVRIRSGSCTATLHSQEATGDAAGSIARVRIYTRAGDDGTTGLYFGGRVRKDDAVDRAQRRRSTRRRPTIGRRAIRARARGASSTSCSSRSSATCGCSWPRSRPRRTTAASSWPASPSSTADDGDDASSARSTTSPARTELPKEFVVPGEDRVAAALDVARTVVRRAERRTAATACEGSLVRDATSTG